MSPIDDPAAPTPELAPLDATPHAKPGVRVAVDAMGGDHGPAEVVPGSLSYARANPQDVVILVGDEPVIREVAGVLPSNVRIAHAPEVIGMDADPGNSVRRMQDSRLGRAAEAVRRFLRQALPDAAERAATA